jgi:hypothetical protein
MEGSPNGNELENRTKIATIWSVTPYNYSGSAMVYLF